MLGLVALAEVLEEGEVVAGVGVVGLELEGERELLPGVGVTLQLGNENAFGITGNQGGSYRIVWTSDAVHARIGRSPYCPS